MVRWNFGRLEWGDDIYKVGWVVALTKVQFRAPSEASPDPCTGGLVPLVPAPDMQR